ncbi:TIGR02646 family protein [Pseudomonas sp. Irchel 3E13]|uniref:TIGR02646 family protein n=1 Tax=Pseudomonas sp. Irchel 3E13 TaxID=2008975 RepID=UPI000BA3D905|nr:TIGR02646 family protein [Pseudomonas sp. Irchel 3E13]
MRKIDKGSEPEALTRFRARNPNKHYRDLSHEERSDIRRTCTAEQLHLCAYCCMPISGERSDTLNEHLLCRDHHPQLSLTFDNIVASCTTPGQCDAAKGNQSAALSPLMAECERELRFLISGRVEGLSPRAIDTISVLNLGDHERNNKKLVEKRRQISWMVLQDNGVEPLSPVEDDELLQMVIDDLSRPDQGKLQPFAPVMVNILRSWLSAGSNER